MTDTATAGNVAGQVGEKDKIEKRRALGRGLASLFGGPRVISPAPPAANGGKQATASTAVSAQLPTDLRPAGRMHVSAPTPAFPVPSGPQIPPLVGSDPIPGDRLKTTIRTEAGEAVLQTAGTAALDLATVATEEKSPLLSTAGRSGAPASESKDFDRPTEIFRQAETRIPGNVVESLAIADIDKNPFQTRYVEDDEKLQELADSIKASGVVQPIVVRPAEAEGRYILILGERRLHASRKAGKDAIPAIVRRVSEQQAAEMTIIENLQREDLSALEQAEAFRVLSSQFQMTQQEIAERVGLSRVSVANYMRLLKLPREVMQLLAERKINFAKAKQLLKLEDNDRIAEAALYAVKKGMTVEQVESLVLRMEGLLDPLPDMPGVQKDRKASGARWVDPNVRAAQMELERMLGVRVRIRDRKGKGRIVIEYSTVDDYERVVGMLRGPK
jgi:ParB family transcriptional regulator, chromosome partitioning protein